VNPPQWDCQTRAHVCLCLYVRADTNPQAQHEVTGKHTGQRRREAEGKRVGRDLGTHVGEGIYLITRYVVSLPTVLREQSLQQMIFRCPADLHNTSQGERNTERQNR